jgi:hypothetical protein
VRLAALVLVGTDRPLVPDWLVKMSNATPAQVRAIIHGLNRKAAT